VIMGLFGISEVLLNIDEASKQEIYKNPDLKSPPYAQDWKDSVLSSSEEPSSVSFLGILPGGGATIASFGAYAVEKRVSKHPEKFGSGAIEGVAAPESANNAASQASFIPLLTMGIPANVVMAILLGH